MEKAPKLKEHKHAGTDNRVLELRSISNFLKLSESSFLLP